MLTIKIPVSDVSLPEADALSHSFRAHGGRNEMVGSYICFPFNSSGENFFSPDAYALCNARGWKCEGGSFYTIQPTEKMSQTVPSEWPLSVINEEQQTYEQYFRCDEATRWDLEDGTTLFRVVRSGGRSLTDEERLLFQQDLGIGDYHFLLVKAAGRSLIPEVQEEDQE